MVAGLDGASFLGRELAEARGGVVFETVGRKKDAVGKCVSRFRFFRE